MENLGALIPIVLVVGIFWLAIVRPAKRRQREHEAVQASAAIGSRVMTASGIFGVIVAESEERLHLQVAPGVVIEVHRQSIGRVIDDEERADPAGDTVDDA